MEGNSSQLLISSKEVAALASKTSACIERGNVGAWNSGVMHKPLADRYHTFWFDNGVLVPPHTTAEGIANGGIQAPLFRGVANKEPAYTPPPTSYLAFPSNAFRGTPFPKEANGLRVGPRFGEMDVHRSVGWSFQAQANNSDVQQHLEVCQRQFVMFDHSGGKRRMISHPAMMNDFSALLPSSLPKIGAHNSNPLSDKTRSSRDTTMVASPFLATTSPLGPSFPYLSSDLLLRNTFVDSHSSASDNCDTPLSSNGVDAEAKREQHSDGSPELSCYSRENTEDLEALLSSDEDEVSSTGHSPSDITQNDSPSSSCSNNKVCSVCASSRKRKKRTENHINDKDTASTATSSMKLCKEMPCQNIDGAGIDSSHGKEGLAASFKPTLVKDLGYGNEDMTAFGMFFSDQLSSSSSANNQKWDNKVLSMQLPLQQQPDVQSRKEKIKSVLRLLRGIIPGGEYMDTAFVLDEAIQYVKTLQFEVQKLQGRKFT